MQLYFVFDLRLLFMVLRGETPGKRVAIILFCLVLLFKVCLFRLCIYSRDVCMKDGALVNFGIVGCSVYTSFLTLVYCF